MNSYLPLFTLTVFDSESVSVAFVGVLLAFVVCLLIVVILERRDKR